MTTQDKLAKALREMTSFAQHMKHPPFGTIANAVAALAARDSDATGGRGDDRVVGEGADAIAKAEQWTCLVCDEPEIENTILTALEALAERAAN